MRCFLFFLAFAAQTFGAGLASYPHLVVADSKGAARDSVRVTYLGTNGYQFEFNRHRLLVDPYFSRVDFWSVALGSRIQPNGTRIDDGLRQLACRSCRTDAVLVTHGHFDHLLDVAAVMAKTNARLIASPTSVSLVRRMPDANGLPADAVKPGDVRRIGPWKIRVLSATHDRLFGKVPYNEPRPQAGPPQRAADWICGEPLAFLIEVNGQGIYIDSGGTPAQLPPNERVDLAILGVALPDSRARLRGALTRLQPRYIVPSHQDDFFRPLSAGFQFAPLSDFSFVQRECAQQKKRQLILLDYFRPWTLPKAKTAEAVGSKSQNPRSQTREKTQNRKDLTTDETDSTDEKRDSFTIRGIRVIGSLSTLECWHFEILPGIWSLGFGISLACVCDFAEAACLQCTA